MSDSEYCRCYNKVNFICGKCMKPYRIPTSKNELIKDLKNRIMKCNEDLAIYRIELQELRKRKEYNSDSESIKTIVNHESSSESSDTDSSTESSSSDVE